MKSLKLNFVVLALVAFAFSPFALAEIALTAGPYLQNPGETSVSVMWITSASSTATVEYGIGDELDKKAVSTHDGQIDANTTIHRVDITGLTAGSKYNYRVVSTEILKYAPYKVTFGETINSETFSFTTLDSKKTACSFVVFNDIHSNVKNLGVRVELANKKPYEMIFLNGDILQDPGSEKLIIDTLLKPASDLFASRIPMLLARGNHETRGAYSRKLKNYVALPDNNYYYSFKHGPVYFIVLDVGEDKEDSNREYSGLNEFDSYRDEQTKWLKKEIKKREFKEAQFRVVLTHIPLFGGGKGHGTLDCRNKWAATLNKGKIDLHISGHTHRPAVVEAVKGVHDYPVFIGGGPHDEKFTVIRVDVANEELSVSMINHSGEVIETYKAKQKKKGLLESVLGS